MSQTITITIPGDDKEEQRRVANALIDGTTRISKAFKHLGYVYAGESFRSGNTRIIELDKIK